MTDTERIEQLAEEVRELRGLVVKLLRPVAVLSDLVIQADYVTKAKGLNKNTISANENLDKFTAPGQRKVLVTLESVSVIKNRKKSGKRR